MRTIGAASVRAIAQMQPQQLESPIEEMMNVALKGAGIAATPQAWIGKHRVDFLVESRGLRFAIECDGRKFHHLNGEQILRDYQRARALLAQRVMLIRFTGGEIFSDPHGCARTVKEIITSLTGE